MVKLGYNIQLISGYEYSKYPFFIKYIDYFYAITEKSVGAARFIAKMHLNQLYGFFGRSLKILETINVYNYDLPKYMSSRIIRSIIEINKEISTLLMDSNINHDILNELNANLEHRIDPVFQLVKSNVAIAAAVTSYRKDIRKRKQKIVK